MIERKPILRHFSRNQKRMSEVTERSWELSNYEANRKAQGVIKTSTNIAVSSKVSIPLDWTGHTPSKGVTLLIFSVFVSGAEMSNLFGSPDGHHDYRGMSAPVL